jgi:hypothetical protein
LTVSEEEIREAADIIATVLKGVQS